MGKTTVLGLAQQARATFDKNIDTMIAAFLIRNPDVNPGDIELVFQPSTDGKMHFWINQCPNGVKLPRAMEAATGDDAYQKGYVEGWNGCRTDAANLNARTPEQLRAPIPDLPVDVESAVIVHG